MTAKTKAKAKVTVKNWADEPRFAFSEVLELTGYHSPYVNGLIVRRQFVPQYPRHQGSGLGGVPPQTYTARDVLRLMAIAPAVSVNLHLPQHDHNGADSRVLELLIQALDRVIDAAIAAGTVPARNFTAPRLAHDWVRVVFDLQRLVVEHLLPLEPGTSV
jgi:hypothetical protein